jgi:hypothetical protein
MQKKRKHRKTKETHRHLPFSGTASMSWTACARAEVASRGREVRRREAESGSGREEGGESGMGAGGWGTAVVEFEDGRVGRGVGRVGSRVDDVGCCASDGC